MRYLQNMQAYKKQLKNQLHHLYPGFIKGMTSVGFRSGWEEQLLKKEEVGYDSSDLNYSIFDMEGNSLF